MVVFLTLCGSISHCHGSISVWYGSVSDWESGMVVLQTTSDTCRMIPQTDRMLKVSTASQSCL